LTRITNEELRLYFVTSANRDVAPLSSRKKKETSETMVKYLQEIHLRLPVFGVETTLKIHGKEFRVDFEWHRPA